MEKAMHAYPASIVLIIIISWLGLYSTTVASSKNSPVAAVGEVIKIVTLENKARLCPNIDCNQNKEILRLPTNIKLKVLSSSEQKLPMWDVIWYKVSYKGKQGWVSEFNTNKAPKNPRYR